MNLNYRFCFVYQLQYLEEWILDDMNLSWRAGLSCWFANVGTSRITMNYQYHPTAVLARVLTQNKLTIKKNIIKMRDTLKIKLTVSNLGVLDFKTSAENTAIFPFKYQRLFQALCTTFQQKSKANRVWIINLMLSAYWLFLLFNSNGNDLFSSMKYDRGRESPLMT